MHEHKSNKEGVVERYYHIRVPVSETVMQSVATVFFRQDGPDEPIYASIARCSKRDNFNRAHGRTLSRRKWFANKIREVNSMTHAEAHALYEDSSFV